MTKKDLFRIIIKLFGVYSIIGFVATFISQIGMFQSFTFSSSSDSTFHFVEILWLLAILTVFSLFAGFLVFSPDSIIKWFKLDKGFDDGEVRISTPSLSNLIGISIIIVGGYVFIENISPLITELGYNIFSSIYMGENSFGSNGMSNYHLYSKALNLVIGYLLITNHRNITRFLLSVNTKKEVNEQNEK